MHRKSFPLVKVRSDMTARSNEGIAQTRRILMFSNSASTTRGGAEASYEAVAAGLEVRGYDILRLYNEPGGVEGNVCRLPLPWINLRLGLPTPRSVWTFICHLLPLARLLRRLKPDVIVVHFIDLSSLYFAMLRLLFGFRLVFNARGSDLLVQPNESARHRKLIPRALRRADHLIALSQPLADRAMELCPLLSGRVTVIHNGVDVDFWHTPVAQPDDAAPLIVAVGRLHPVKGFDVLIDAFRLVSEQLPRARLCIVGEGAERENLEAQIDQLGLVGCVELPGWGDAETLRRAYQRASIVAVPSRSEGMGNVAVEAMAAGAAVVASNVGGLPDVVSDRETGLLVPAEDPAALANAMMTLLDAPHYLDTMRRQAKAHASYFSWDVCLSLYERVLKT